MEHKQTDHDLLVTIHTKLERALEDIREIRDNTTGRIITLESDKLDKTEAEEMKKSIAWLQRIAFGGLGILAAIQFYFNVIKK